jgi:HTH-type transcriptional regulator / antitoxin HipB
MYVRFVDTFCERVHGADMKEQIQNIAKLHCRIVKARESAGLTQEELAVRLKTQKTAISRIENHAEDIKLSTLARVAKALGKRLEVNIA